MALLNKYQLKFHSFQDAKLLMNAIEKRYGGNKESKKVEKTFLKQQYENFTALSLETIDQTFFISQLEIQGEVINQDDNLKLLRSLPSEWKTHALIWRNKVEIETISLDDLYNNLKIYELEITDDTAHGVSTTYSTTHTQGNGVNFVCLDNLCDAVICAFLNKGRENSSRTTQIEFPTHNALIAQDGIGGYDWSYQAEEEQPLNHALMALTSSGISSNSDSEVDSCFKTCMKAYAVLKDQYDNLSSDYKKSQFNLLYYKAGLKSVEARLVYYKKNEAVFEENINVLKLKGLGYSAATAASPTVESFMNLTNKSGSDKGYQTVPLPLSRTFIPGKPYLTFIDEIVESVNMDITTIISPNNAKTVENKGGSNTVESNAVRLNNTSAPIIEDWISDDESEVEPNDRTVRPSTEKIKSAKTVREIDAPKHKKINLVGTKEIGTILCPKD
ncbi:hypothetical protein Tco_1248916 [Tanacetum coccineum]